ncbi:hypothetical protein [Desulfosarcina cetonica]|uniref:hypothetical protein n=1 Tax=Desulfosarcina cetonica TaxID=90730 RepID=UPI001C4519E6|nr:hypothetical protein [Desulfosarcina cetonica]
MPEAIDKAREWMQLRRLEFESGIRGKLDDHMNALDRLRKKQHQQLELQFEESRQHEKIILSQKAQKGRRIDGIFNAYRQWIKDTMSTEDNPYIQVIAVFKGN